MQKNNCKNAKKIQIIQRMKRPLKSPKKLRLQITRIAKNDKSAMIVKNSRIAENAKSSKKAKKANNRNNPKDAKIAKDIKVAKNTRIFKIAKLSKKTAIVEIF